jgi:hypothetical protein
MRNEWWYQHIAKKTKKMLGRCLMESVMMYGSEIWAGNKKPEKQATDSRNGLPTTGVGNLFMLEGRINLAVIK